MSSWDSNHLRDYHEEFKVIVECRDPMYKPHHTTLWTENVTKHGNTPGNQLVEADQKIETLQVTQNKLQNDADALTLARDEKRAGSKACEGHAYQAAEPDWVRDCCSTHGKEQQACVWSNA